MGTEHQWKQVFVQRSHAQRPGSQDKTGVRCWENRQRAPLPEVLKDKACNAMIQWTGTWETKNQQGLCLKVTDVEIMEQEIEYPFGTL